MRRTFGFGVEIVASALTACVVIALCVSLPLPRQAAPPVPRAIDGDTPYSLDSVSVGAQKIRLRWHPQPEIVLERDRTLAFDGWAVDAASHVPAGEVVAVVDGANEYRAATGMLRPDVATTLGNATFATSGFHLEVPARSLSAGTHRIGFRFAASTGAAYYRSRDDVDIVVIADGATATGSIDSLRPGLDRAGAHRMTGWLIDERARSVVRGVNVEIDGRFVARARYGLSRPDVARALSVPAYAASGFDAAWTDGSLPRGLHVLRIDATGSGVLPLVFDRAFRR